MPTKKRYSVLTYIINDYEKPREVLQSDPEAEYVLVTDDKNLTSNTWNIIYDADLEGLSVFDKCYAIRFNCFKYCNTDICVRIDGSIELKLSLKPLLDVFEEGKYDACLMPHPLRDNFRAEYSAWIKQRGYDRAQAERCMKYMSEKGYNFNYKGLFQCGFAIQRRGIITEKIDQMSLSILKELGHNGVIERLDQIPVSFVINKFFSHLNVLPISSQIFSSPYMQLYLHKSDIFNLNHMPNITKRDYHYMFNKKVECLYMFPAMIESEKEHIINREYELLRRIRSLQNAVNAKTFERLNLLESKTQKHLLVIRVLFILNMMFVLIIVLIILQLFFK